MKLSTFNAVCDLISSCPLFVRAARILTAIHADPTVGPTDLSIICQCSTAAITGLTDRLEREGYFTRGHTPNDRRKIAFVLAEKGHHYVQTILPAEELK